MFQLVIDNPWVFVIAALIGLITGWWIWAGRSESVSGTGIGGVAAGVGGAVGGVASGVTNTASKAASGVADTAKGAAGAVGDAASGAVDKVGDVASSAADTAKGAAGTATGAVKGAAGKATGAAKGAAGKAGKAASGAKDKVAKATGKPKITAAVGDPDDLTRIKGIGPKLNELCHSLGVLRFDQIAKWSKSDVAEVDQYLKIKGRIDRDKWVAQAKLLAAGNDAGHKAKFG